MITAKSLTNGTLTVIIDNGNEIHTARSDRPKWTEILAAYKSGNDNLLLALISMKAVVENYTVGRLSVNGTGVTYNGSPIHAVDADRVMAFLREGLPYQPIANYMERCRKNQSARAIVELYPFLEHRNMPLTPEGFIIAYKGVQSNLYSVMGNTKTVVLQGKTDSEGHILNEIGQVIEIERSSCDDDFRNGCSFGLHAGSLAYARGWGARVILILIDPADVVSVPEDCNCQKLRCCKYKVLGEYTGPMPDTYTSEFSGSAATGKECPGDGCDGCDSCMSDADTCPTCGLDTCEGECDCDCTCGGTDCPNCGCECEDCRNQFQGESPAERNQRENEAWLYEQMHSKSDASKVAESESSNGFPTDSVTKRVLDIIIEQLVLDVRTPFTPSTTLLSLGADDLDEVELSMALEEEFGFELSEEEEEDNFNAHTTLHDIVNLVQGHVNPAPKTISGVQPHQWYCCAGNPECAALGHAHGPDATPKQTSDLDDDEASYLQGMQKGVSDRAENKQAQFLAGDQEAADSPRHARFIDGYVCGYA